jgi:hypothetical protein
MKQSETERPPFLDDAPLAQRIVDLRVETPSSDGAVV